MPAAVPALTTCPLWLLSHSESSEGLFGMYGVVHCHISHNLLYLLLKFLCFFFFFFPHSLSTASDIKSACSCSFHVCVSILHWSAAVPPVLLVCRSAPLSLKPVLASYLSLSVGCADELVVSFAKIILPLINSSFNILYMQCSAKL